VGAVKETLSLEHPARRPPELTSVNDSHNFTLRDDPQRSINLTVFFILDIEPYLLIDDLLLCTFLRGMREGACTLLEFNAERTLVELCIVVYLR